MTNIPHGFQEIVAYYGNPAGHNGNPSPAWEDANLVKFTPPYQFYTTDSGAKVPVSHFTVHKLIVPDLQHILADVYAAARAAVKANDGYKFDSAYYDKRTLETLAAHGCDIFSGSFVYRDKRGQPGVPSVHSFGVAIDFDAEHNAFGAQKGRLPDWFITAFTSRGWEWGGQWHGADKDWMHMERCQGY